MLNLFKIKNNLEFRNKWIEEKLKSVNKGLKILDAGCGHQNYRKFCKHQKILKVKILYLLVTK